jgi:uncharacterized membrane protein YcaP (DUF421 family)
MKDALDTLFGHGSGLNALQMGCRAFVMFFIALLIIRVSGMRSFGKKSAFDSIIVIMLGAILSRAVVGADAFLPIVASGFVLAIIHRILGWLSVEHNLIGRFVKGSAVCLYKEGKFNRRNMLLSSISFKDIMEEVRVQLNEASLDNVEEVFMERSGQISIVKKNRSV